MSINELGFNQLTMEEAVSITDNGTEDIVRWLLSRSGAEVVNVENIDIYREEDVDLLYFKTIGDKKIQVKIEIKVDTQHKTGNFFFETISNTTKQTKGCFYKTKCDLLFYYFVGIKTLYILEINKVREWFDKNKNKLRVAYGTTAIPNGDFYRSEGRLVPIKRLEKHLNITKVILQ